MKQLTKTMQVVKLATAINAVKVDNENRKALRGLARAYDVDLEENIKISPRNSHGHYNFGEIAECILRLAHGLSGKKQSKNNIDLTINGLDYEVKAINRDGKPSPSKGAKANTPTLIVANLASEQRGVYLIPYGEIVWNTSNHMVAKPTLEKAKLVKAF